MKNKINWKKAYEAEMENLKYVIKKNKELQNKYERANKIVKGYLRNIKELRENLEFETLWSDVFSYSAVKNEKLYSQEKSKKNFWRLVAFLSVIALLLKSVL